MGKGDKKSKKGKRFSHSYGKTRLRKKKIVIVSKKKVEEKPKPVEQKKSLKPETEKEQPAEVVTSVVEEFKIETPQVTEIKEEVQVPVITESPVSEIPEIEKKPEALGKVEVEEKIEKDVVKEEKKEAPKTEVKKEEPETKTPKKRGRPKKKKE